MKIQVALFVNTRSSKTGTEESKETQTESRIASDKETSSSGHTGNKTICNYPCNKCEWIFYDTGKMSIDSLLKNVNKIKIAGVGLVDKAFGLSKPRKNEISKWKYK